MEGDVAIFGAGPAALCAAILLMRNGSRVICIEAASLRIERPGETLPGAALRLLRSLSLPFDERDTAHRRLTGISVAWSSRQLSERDYLGEPDGPSWLIDRSRFDWLLRREANRLGAVWVNGPLARLERAGTGWIVTLRRDEVAVRYILDGTGRAAPISRRLGARRLRGHQLFAHWAVASSQRPRLDRPLIETERGEWWYAINLPGNRTFACLHNETAHEGDAADRMRHWQRKFAALEWLPRFAPAATDFSQLRTSDASGSRLDIFAGDGWLACGDAALAFDPMSSQGLFSAIATANMAARSLLSEEVWAQTARQTYQDALEKIWGIYEARRDAFHLLANSEPVSRVFEE
ncbi:NAD(P)/FAD-dependent oxidoreductase [Rhizobium leguminosarum]